MNEGSGTRRALGRGLGALLEDAGREEPVTGRSQSSGVKMIPVAALTPHPKQPRRRFDEDALRELAESIAARGLIQPIVARAHGHGYQIVAGERRWRAAQRAHLHEVPVLVRDFSESETLEVALLENIQRQDLNAVEEAQAYERLIAEFGHTQEALGAIVNKSRSHVANLLRLLALPQSVQDMVVDGSLTMGHARALIGAADAEDLAGTIVARGLSVRDTEKLIRQTKGKEETARSDRRQRLPDNDIQALQHQLGDILGLTVRIAHADPGGSISLTYTSLDQLDMICQRLTGETA